MITQTTYAIIRSTISSPLVPDMVAYEYRKLSLPYNETVISESRAKQLIASDKMQLVVNNKHGKVWELPDNSFKKEYKKLYNNEN